MYQRNNIPVDTDFHEHKLSIFMFLYGLADLFVYWFIGCSELYFQIKLADINSNFSLEILDIIMKRKS